jgi:hypothetical protein
VPKKKNLVQKKKWSRKYLNAKDDPYEALIFAYNKEMDQLVEANMISSEVEEEDFIACLDDGMTESDDEEENMVLKITCLLNTMMNFEEENKARN